MELIVIIVGLLIIFLAAVVQGTTGFGFALTSMPLLALLISLQTVVPMMILFGLLSNMLLLVKIWPYVKLKKIWLMIVSSLVAAPIGAYLLVLIEERVLKGIVGLLIILFAFALWKGFSVKVKNESVASVPVGFASGLLNGSLSLSGPPIVLFLTNQKEEKMTFRANISAFFLILNIVTIISFFMGGLVDKEVITYSAWFFPAFLIGTFLGANIAGKVEQALFRKITLGLIIVSGLSAIMTSIY